MRKNRVSNVFCIQTAWSYVEAVDIKIEWAFSPFVEDLWMKLSVRISCLSTLIVIIHNEPPQGLLWSCPSHYLLVYILWVECYFPTFLVIVKEHYTRGCQDWMIILVFEKLGFLKSLYFQGGQSTLKNVDFHTANYNLFNMFMLIRTTWFRHLKKDFYWIGCYLTNLYSEPQKFLDAPS